MTRAPRCSRPARDGRRRRAGALNAGRLAARAVEIQEPRSREDLPTRDRLRGRRPAKVRVDNTSKWIEQPPETRRQRASEVLFR